MAGAAGAAWRGVSRHLDAVTANLVWLVGPNSAGIAIWFGYICVLVKKNEQKHRGYVHVTRLYKPPGCYKLSSQIGRAPHGGIPLILYKFARVPHQVPLRALDGAARLLCSGCGIGIIVCYDQHTPW